MRHVVNRFAGHSLQAIAVVALLGGCSDERARRQAELAPLIGKSEVDLVRTLGVPARTHEAGGRKFLAYVEDRSVLLPAVGPFGPYGNSGAPLSAFSGIPPELVPRICETTFELEDGLVRAFSLHGEGCG